MSTEQASQATAELKDKDGKAVRMATFRESGSGVRVNLDQGTHSGLARSSCSRRRQMRGAGIYQRGGPLQSGAKKHGQKSPEGAHAGDLPNMLAAKGGTGRFEAFTDGMTLKPGGTSVFDKDGSALVIHAGVDDYITDPTAMPATGPHAASLR